MTNRPRKKLSLTVKLAATLLALTDAKGELLIPHDHAKLMSAEQVISLFEFDHYPIRHEAGGPDEPWNIQPLMIAPHGVKTATIDQPAIAKISRVSEEQAEFRQRMLAKSAPDDDLAPAVPRRAKRSRSFPEGKRTIQSRNNLRKENRK